MRDILIGTPGDDVICGLEGNDIIYGEAGHDLLCGGPGNDQLHGDLDDDVLVGGPGKDLLVGGPGHDLLQGGLGKDSLLGGHGNDELRGNHGKDALQGGAGNDFLHGGKGRDTIDGDAGENVCINNKRPADIISNCLEHTESLAINHFFARDNKIYDPQGNLFVPKGVNIFPWHHTPGTVAHIQECWRFNLVRLHAWIFPRVNTQPKDHIVYIENPLIFSLDQTAFTTYDVSDLIENYTSKGIVVLFDIHEQLGAYIEDQDMADYLTFIEEFAYRYKNNPYVWLDIHNEPGEQEGIMKDANGDPHPHRFDRWRDETITILDTVKSIAPHMMTFVSGIAYGQDTGPTYGSDNVNPAESALLSNTDVLTRYDNTVATFHIYDQWIYGTARLENYLASLMANSDVPIVVGEYGSVNVEIDTLPAAQSLHELLTQPAYAHIGRIVWVWDAMDGNDLTLDATGGGGYAQPCEPGPTNLTLLGQLVWDDNH